MGIISTPFTTRHHTTNHWRWARARSRDNLHRTTGNISIPFTTPHRTTNHWRWARARSRDNIHRYQYRGCGFSRAWGCWWRHRGWTWPLNFESRPVLKHSPCWSRKWHLISSTIILHSWIGGNTWIHQCRADTTFIRPHTTWNNACVHQFHLWRFSWKSGHHWWFLISCRNNGGIIGVFHKGWGTISRRNIRWWCTNTIRSNFFSMVILIYQSWKKQGSCKSKSDLGKLASNNYSENKEKTVSQPWPIKADRVPQPHQQSQGSAVASQVTPSPQWQSSRKGGITYSRLWKFKT